MGNEFSQQEGDSLLSLARQSIQDHLEGREDGVVSLKKRFSDRITQNQRGVFVSLHKQGALRGCIGNIEPVKTVFKGVIENAKHAAFNDSRFTAISRNELENTQIEISILTLPETIEYADETEVISKLRPGIDGVIIKKSYKQATFLPQVWKQLASPADFLSHLCMKAGLPSQEWRDGDLEVSVYQVQSFEDDPDLANLTKSGDVSKG